MKIENLNYYVMPIIKAAIKAMKQARVREARNQMTKSHMKSVIKRALDYIKAGQKEKALKMLPQVLSAIDTAAKKYVIHKNNAARKKSRIQKAVHVLSTK